ncbi:MAG: sulfotransferase [Gammaproteobacteria bacterium]|nr:sulfotransferase [Gammaproteobacteria bacterium]
MLNQQLTHNKQQAWKRMSQGRYQDALKILAKIKKQSPNDAELMYMYGCCYANMQQWNNAIKAFELCIQIKPDVAQSHFAYAGAMIAIGEQEKAIHCLQNALKYDDNMDEAHCSLANLLVAKGDIEAAKDHLNHVIELNPNKSDAYFILGRIEQEAGAHKIAILYFEKTIKLDSNNINALNGIATSLMNLARKNDAKNYYKKALKIDKGDIGAISGLALVYASSGDYKKSGELINPILDKKIINPSIGLAFAQICRYLNKCSEAIAYIETVLKLPSLPKPMIKSLNISIGQLLDKKGEFDRAFSHFKIGNDVMRNMYEAVSHKKQIDEIMEVFNSDFYMKHSGAYSLDTTPVFIVGMPRSGTSLTEQILAAHSEVFAAGELTYLYELTMGSKLNVNNKKQYPGLIKEASNDQLRKVADEYLSKTAKLSNNAHYVIDKMPHNFYLLGLIQLIFPKSKIIHCTRDPLDTSLSIYFQDFTDGHQYSNDLFNIGTHYNQYQYLMDYWDKVLNIPILHVAYEDLVSDQEMSTRKILEFIGLEWEDDCMNFHKVDREVNTASVHQVRQPMYKDSLNRWRNYEKYLSGLKEGLARDF